MRNDDFTGRDRPRRPAVPAAAAGQRGGAILAIGDVLTELLTQYQVRFPHLKLTLVETPAETL